MITGTKGYTFIRASESPQACYYLQPLAARSVAVIRIIWMTIWLLTLNKNRTSVHRIGTIVRIVSPLLFPPLCSKKAGFEECDV